MQCSSDIDIKGVLNALARSASDGWGAELSQIMAVDIEYSSGLQPDMVAKPVPGACTYAVLQPLLLLLLLLRWCWRCKEG